ncbi:multicopper oxidase family protein [Agromyces sp. Soil535]|uniref:multicopper oxidase family protein n=1 Tax=Agromyces sp. Soil535 TaxID=1736390 RepID=UPI0035197B11
MTRRTVLVLGGVGAAALVGGGLFVWSRTQSGEPDPRTAATPSPTSTRSPPGEETGTLLEPEVLTSSGGRLGLTLTAALTDVVVAGTPVRALTYNGTLPGPTLRVRPGDRIALGFRSELDAATNLHMHGLVVSPEGSSDNPFLLIEPGDTFDYEYQLGADHSPGVFWYHPHRHGNAAEQLFRGLYGAIIVEDEEPVEATRERLLMISDIAFDGGGVHVASQFERMLGREGDIVMVNGQVGATLLAKPGERERWRIVNACSSRFLRLRLDGQRMQLLGVDAGRYAEPQDVEEIMLTPGNRADVMVTAVEGTSVLQTLPFDRGGMGMMGSPSSTTTGADLLTLTVAGTPSTAPPLVVPQPTTRDLRLEQITGQRTVTLAMGAMGAMGMGGMSFTIDGREFDHERVDTEVSHGAIEEWTIVNTSPMDHPFHLHVWPMQLVEVGGTSLADVDWRDVVPVRARSTTVVRIAFGGLLGRTVYHCHILDHEDNGMMGVIRVD